MADNGYDPQAKAMALWSLHLEQQYLPGTDSVYFDIDNTPGLNMTSTIPLFI